MKPSAVPNPMTSSPKGRFGPPAPRWPGWPATTTPRAPRRTTGWPAPPVSWLIRGWWAICRRWAHLAGNARDTDDVVDTVTPFRLEVSGDWRAAAAEWTRLGCPYDAAVAQLGGDIGAVQAALTTFRGLGARAAGRRAQQRLAQLRGRTPRGRRADTLADPHRLTRRQRDVLDLLVAGQSDTDIAAKLCISPRTVAHHVEAILAKLGVHNRTQAAAVYSSK